MNKHINRLFSSVFILFTAQQAQADSNCCDEPCDPPCIDFCSGEFYVSGALLYWNAGSNNLYYVLESSSDISDLVPPKDVITTTHLREPGFSWHSGVRASIGWRECDCGWDFGLTGTYYKTHSKDTVIGNTTNFGAPILNLLTPLLNPSLSGNFLGSTTQVGTASGRWDLKFGMIDALGGGRFKPWNCLTLKPNFGLRTAWIQQHLRVRYSPISFVVLGEEFTILTADESLTNLKNHYWGIGFKGGIDFEASLCSNFSLIGGFGGSLLYGKMDKKSFLFGHTIDPGAPDGLNNVTNSINKKFNKMAADLESDLGLAYKFNCGCFGFNLSASYMFSIWFDQSEFDNFLFTSASVNTPMVFLNFQKVEKIYSNLIMQGISIQLEVTF